MIYFSEEDFQYKVIKKFLEGLHVFLLEKRVDIFF